MVGLRDARLSLDGPSGPFSGPAILSQRFKSMGVFPYDLNPVARPGASSSINRAAINAAFATGERVCFESGNYAIDGTIFPNPGGLDAGWYRHVRFNQTQFTASGSVTNFQECLGMDRTWNGSAHVVNGGGTLAGRSGVDNIPAPPGSIHVMWDMSQARGSFYDGNVLFHGAALGGNLPTPPGPKLAALSCSNKWDKAVFGGGAESTWTGQVQFAQVCYGMYGTPKYLPLNGNTFYPDTFVGSVFAHVRFAANVGVPILCGGNTLDDVFIAHLNVPCMAGARSYLQATALTAGNVFVNGRDPADIAFDIHSSMFKFALFYAEDNESFAGFYAPIVVRDEGWIEGIMKHGAGTESAFVKGCMAYFDGAAGGGLLTAHERSGDASGMVSLVRLNCDATTRSRMITVHQPYAETKKPAFFAEGAVATTDDKLIVYAPGIGAAGGMSQYVRNTGSGTQVRGLRRETFNRTIT